MPLEKPPIRSPARSASPASPRTRSISAWRPFGGQPAELRVQRQHLVRGQPRLVAEQLGQVADPPPRLAVAERPAEHLAGRRRSDA